MNTKLFSEAMSEVNDKYYEEAANYHCKKHGWVKFTSLAACAAIVLAVSFATLWKLPSQTTPQPEYEPPIITNPDNQSDNPEQGISLNINEISTPNTISGNIALMTDDYTAISYEELLRYFDVSLPITETLPYLTLQSNDFGIYQTDNRGIYYDGNFIEFRNSVLCLANAKTARAIGWKRRTGIGNFLLGCTGYLAGTVLPEGVQAVAAAICWGIVPLVTLWVASVKKLQKNSYLCKKIHCNPPRIVLK